ncbi:MAG: hypothetical protein ACYTGG_10605 [Planctomycetota bacterium]|jgi:hypothetical protein
MHRRPRIKPWLPWTFLAVIGIVIGHVGLFQAGKAYSAYGQGDVLRIVLGLVVGIAGFALGLHAVQRRQRIRFPGHRCRRCGYDLRGSPGRVCSECGEPVGRGQGLSWSP